MNWVAKERRLIAFDYMADELKYPTNDEQSQRPTPTEEEHRQRHDNHRNPDRVRQTVERMPMLGFVVIERGLRHVYVEGVQETRTQCPLVLPFSGR